MNNETTSKLPIWFWITGVIALLWNGAGVNFYLQQAYNTESHRAMYTEKQLEMINSMPAWATAAFALAVFAGLIGCILLLLRKKSAKSVFFISLLGILAHQIIYNLFLSEAIQEFGNSAIIMPIFTLLIGILLYWFSGASIKRGWLK